MQLIWDKICLFKYSTDNVQKQFQTVHITEDLNFDFLFYKNLHVWLGGLFIPEAYITATRQFVAQANSWSLEELYLQVSLLLFNTLVRPVLRNQLLCIENCGLTT